MEKKQEISVEESLQSYKKCLEDEQYEEALKYWLQLGADDPSYKEDSEYWMRAGHVALLANKVVDSHGFLDEALRLEPRSRDAYFHKGMGYEFSFEDRKAIQSYQKAIELSEGDLLQDEIHKKAITKKANLHFSLGEFDEAIETDSSRRLQFTYFKEVNQNIKDQKFESAIDYCDKLLALEFFDLWQVWYLKGIANFSLSKYIIAITCYDNSIKLTPNCRDVYCHKARAHEYLQDFNLAIDCYDIVIKLSEENNVKDKLYYEAKSNKATLHYRMGDIDKGIECFKNMDRFAAVDAYFRKKPPYHGVRMRHTSFFLSEETPKNILLMHYFIKVLKENGTPTELSFSETYDWGIKLITENYPVRSLEITHAADFHGLGIVRALAQCPTLESLKTAIISPEALAILATSKSLKFLTICDDGNSEIEEQHFNVFLHHPTILECKYIDKIVVSKVMHKPTISQTVRNLIVLGFNRAQSTPSRLAVLHKDILDLIVGTIFLELRYNHLTGSAFLKFLFENLQSFKANLASSHLRIYEKITELSVEGETAVKAGISSKQIFYQHSFRLLSVPDKAQEPEKKFSDSTEHSKLDKRARLDVLDENQKNAMTI